MNDKQQVPAHKNRRAGGRPEKKEEEKLAIQYNLRLTKVDSDRLQKRLQQERLVRQIKDEVFLREIIVSSLNNRKQSSNKELKIQYYSFLHKFNDLGNDLIAIRANHNQVVKKINALPLTKELKKQLQENYLLETTITSLLERLQSVLSELESIMLLDREE